MSVLDKKEKTELTLEDALSALDALGLSYAEFSFDGAGDSGDIYEASYGYVTFDDALSGLSSWESRTIKLMPNVATHKIARSVQECLEQHVHYCLDDSGVDWYNNCGGFGSYTFYKKDGKWKYDFQINTRYTQYDCMLDETGIDIHFEEGEE